MTLDVRVIDVGELASERTRADVVEHDGPGEVQRRVTVTRVRVHRPGVTVRAPDIVSLEDRPTRSDKSGIRRRRDRKRDGEIDVGGQRIEQRGVNTGIERTTLL